MEKTTLLSNGLNDISNIDIDKELTTLKESFINNARLYMSISKDLYNYSDSLLKILTDNRKIKYADIKCANELLDSIIVYNKISKNNIKEMIDLFEYCYLDTDLLNINPINITNEEKKRFIHYQNDLKDTIHRRCQNNNYVNADIKRYLKNDLKYNIKKLNRIIDISK